MFLASILFVFGMPLSTSVPMFLGVDVGGTNVKLGIATDSGQIIGATSFPTRSEFGPDYVIAETVRIFGELRNVHGLSPEQVVAVGLGTPGPMDISRGLILEPVNLPAWKNFPIRDRLSDALDLPVTFSNDANAAAFGEYWLGSARGLKSLVYFTLGTGVGGGIIVDDCCIEGAHSLGAELGHICVDWSETARWCPCRRKGHLEAYASATGLVARARERLRQEGDSRGDLEQLSAKTIGEWAEAGDPQAVSLVDETAEYLARGLAVVAHTIDPEAILLGGAMTFGEHETHIGRRFLDTLRTRTCELVFPEITRHMKIDFASLGTNAGFIGAAGLARLAYHRFSPQAP